MVVGIPLQAHQPTTLAGEGQRWQSLISDGDAAAFVERLLRWIDLAEAQSAEVQEIGSVPRAS